MNAMWAGLISMALIGFFAWSNSRWNPWRDSWQQWEGSIISGIKWAEKQIPPDCPNAGLAKLDHALEFVIRAYTEARGKAPSERLAAEIKQGIQIIHADLERDGLLRKGA